jgi:sulfoxide reductase catalytic subunit YedY
MLIKSRRSWELPERTATPEKTYLHRRTLLAGTGLAGAGLVGGGMLASALSSTAMAQDDPSAGLYPVPRNHTYELTRPLTSEDVATSYNNFYEFGSHKQIANAAQALPIRPWEIQIDGLVNKPITLDIDALLARVQLEERLYRLRCVERVRHEAAGRFGRAAVKRQVHCHADVPKP